MSLQRFFALEYLAPWCLAACLAVTPVMAAPVDVRILVDVSGSMKTNDPANLRVPALRLVAELMPRDATAGVWLFSEAVEPLVNPGAVDDAWKKSALAAVGRIHSRGQYTDIEAALLAASGDWRNAAADDATERHLIVLTDGVVDVAQGGTESAASRVRIIDRHLGALQRAGVQIHTIALSNKSDRELLSRLAEMSGGWAEQVDDAAALQRVFLHMFEQAAKPDALPLDGNEFAVDSAISEMTLLVFRATGSEPLQLTSPAGEPLTFAAHAANVRWRQDAGYDLVTVNAPAAGTWRINTEPDPDNRVMIVTDLKLEIDEPPAGLLAEESVQVRARITEHGAHLEKPDFLQLLQAELAIGTVGSAGSNAAAMTYDAAEFEFKQERTVDWPPGDYEFVVRVDGGTFQRERRAKVRIYGAPFSFESRIGGDGRSLEVTLEAQPDLVDLDSLAGLLLVARPDETSEVIDLPAFREPKLTLSIPAARNGQYRVEPRLFARATSGRPLQVDAEALTAEITAGDDPPPEVAAVAPPPLKPTINWLKSAALVGAGNVAMMAFVGGIWFATGRRKGANKEVVLA